MSGASDVLASCWGRLTVSASRTSNCSVDDCSNIRSISCSTRQKTFLRGFMLIFLTEHIDIKLSYDSPLHFEANRFQEQVLERSRIEEN